MGGVTVTTPEVARMYSTLLREQVDVGQHLEEPECLPETHPQWRAAIAAGRECPRVSMDRDDAIPYELLLLAASEHTRPLFEPYFRASCGHLDAEERQAVLSRVHAGLTSEPIMAKLFPKVEKHGS